MAWGLETKKLGLTKKQRDAYSLGRVLTMLMNPFSASARKEAGFELDVSDQICRRDNRETDGIIIPQEILDHGYRTNRPLPRSGHLLTDQVIRGLPPPSHQQKRSLSFPKRMHHRTTLTAGTASTAGNLIDTELQSVVLTLVENTLALQNVPSYTVMGSPVYFPRQTGRVQASWGTEGVGPIEPEIASVDLSASTFNNATTQAAVTALTGATVRWALITESSVKYLAFKNIEAADETLLSGLEIGREIQVYADGGSTVLMTFTVAGAYDTDNDRIQVNADADVSTLTTDTDYDLKTVGIPAVTAESNPTYDRVSFSEKHLKCLVPITRTLLLQANTDADDLIRGDIAIGMAKALDTALFYGNPVSNAPQGVKGTTGITSTTWAATKIHEKVLETMAAIGVSNVPTRNLKWFGSWRFAHDCKRAQKLNSYSEKRVLDADGTIEGVPVEVSSQIVGTASQTAEGFLADWTEAALVLWQDLDVVIDPYSKLDQGIIRFVATLVCDFNVLRPEAFGRLGGA